MSQNFNRPTTTPLPTLDLGPFGVEGLNWGRANNRIRIMDELRRISRADAESNRDQSSDSSFSSSSSLSIHLPQSNDSDCPVRPRTQSRMNERYPQGQSVFSSLHSVLNSSSSNQGPSSTSSSSRLSSPEMASCSSSPLRAAQSTSGPSKYCLNHKTTYDAYCQTCSMAICNQCPLSYHNSHNTITISEAIRMVKHESMRIYRDITHALRDVERDLETIAIHILSMDSRFRDIIKEINECWLLLNVTLDERSRNVFKASMKAKELKEKMFREKEAGLNECRTRLLNIINQQNVAFNSTSAENNPSHLNIANSKAMEVTVEVEERRNSLMELEKSSISFTESHRKIMDAIAALESIGINNPGPIGDGRRLIKGRGHTSSSSSSSTSTSTSTSTSSSFIISKSPRGKAIAASLYRVTVWCEKPQNTIYYPPIIKSIGKNILDSEHPDNLCRPWGIACDKYDNIFVADRSNNRILIFREDGSIIRKMGSYGAGPGQFNRPAGITIDERNRMIIADKDNHRIQILTKTGEFLLEFGKKGSECGEFNYPWDVAANTASEIVVSDTRNHRIQLFSPEGIFLRKFGMDTIFGSFKLLDSPRGVAFTPEGNIILTDFNAHRILCIDYKFTNAKVLSCEGAMRAASNFHRPQGVIVDDEGNILVSDSRGYRIIIFNKFGDFLHEFGKQGEAIDEMDRPSGIALMNDGRIVFVDFGNNRVVIR